MIILVADETITEISKRIKTNNNYYTDCVEAKEAKNKAFTTLWLSGIAVFKFSANRNEPTVEITNKYIGLLGLGNDTKIIKDKANWSTVIFDNKVEEHILENINNIFDTCYKDSAVDIFGCCSRYLECSDAKRCVHPDKKDARGCMYKVNLDNGRIFYGNNRNID